MEDINPILEFDVVVSAKLNVNTGLADIVISLPAEQENLSVSETAHMLISAVSLLVKSCNNADVGIKDYELLKEVVDHLHEEFASTISFENLFIEPKYFRKENDEPTEE